MRKASVCVLILLLALPLTALAQQVPKPKEFYFDEDASVARAIVAIEGNDEATITQLVKLMERGGRNSDRAVAQLAHLSMASNRVDNGKALYQRAIGETSQRSMQRYALHWNYGWDLYRSGDSAAALEQWLQAFSTRVVSPAWVPPTLALVLWKEDRKREAVEWYAAAVRTEPQQWTNPALFPALLPDWTEADRAVLRDVFQAWSEDPPRWP